MKRSAFDSQGGDVVVKKEGLVSDQQVEPTLDLVSRQTNQTLEVQERLKGILKHEWFSQENMEQGKDHLEALCHGLYNCIPKQVEMHYRSLIEIYDQDRAEKAIEVARDVGINCKLFAVMEVEGIDFLIKGADFDWRVWKIDFSDEEVPCEFLRRLTILRNSGVEFEGYAIAVPEQVKYQPLIKAMTQEAVKMGKKGAVAIGAATKAVGEAASAVHQAILIADPIILGRYGRLWIEIGRWV